MKKHRTALGKLVDMSELVAKNAKTRAVGNMRVNARGDTIDSTGKIIEPVTSKVNNGYAKTVGNRSAQPVRPQQAKPSRPGNDPGSPTRNSRTVPTHSRPAPPAPPVVDQYVEPELTEAEKELEEELMDDIEVENIKAKESE